MFPLAHRRSFELGILMSLLSVDVLKCYKPTPAVYRLVTESFKYSPSYVTRQRMLNIIITGSIIKVQTGQS